MFGSLLCCHWAGNGRALRGQWAPECFGGCVKYLGFYLDGPPYGGPRRRGGGRDRGVRTFVVVR